MSNSPNDTKTKLNSSSLESEVEGARILFQEGLVEEAKRALFRVLFSEPQFQSAQALLSEIQTFELNEIYKNKNPRHGRAQESAELRDWFKRDEVLQELQSDLGFELEPSVDSGASVVVSGQVELCNQSRLDLSIGFLEMEKYDEALRELDLISVGLESQNNEFVATILWVKAKAWMGKKEYYRVLSLLEPFIEQENLGRDSFVALNYAYALAALSINEMSLAKERFEKVVAIDPHYLDARFHLSKLHDH